VIYFAQLPTGVIKIGYTDDLNSRMAQLQDHYGCGLDVLHVLPGDRLAEADMHRKFAHLRFGRSEQFRPAADLMEFIGLPFDESRRVVEFQEVCRVKLPADVMESARIVAAYTGEAMAEMLGDILRPVLAKRERDEAAKREKATRKPKGGDE